MMHGTTHQPPLPLVDDLSQHWLLDPTVTFLNHGSFGATPRCVLQVQQKFREEMEHQPVEFIDRRGSELLTTARNALAGFIHADANDIGFVTNATEGVTAAIRSINFTSEDRIITTHHRYDAIGNTLQHVAKQRGCELTFLPIDLPFRSDDLLGKLEATLQSEAGPTPRLVVMDHVSSVSAIIFPVHDIARLCAKHGVELLIDGAHAPGMLDLDVPAIGATYYTGNCHKWMSAPKGAAFLWVHPDHQHDIHPSIVSNYYPQGFRPEFDWQGTRDITAWLSVPAAIKFYDQFGWDNVRRHNVELTRYMRELLCNAWDVQPITHESQTSIGSIATIPLPEKVAAIGDTRDIHAAIYNRSKVEVPVFMVNDQPMVRPSCQIYNTPGDYEKLAETVLNIKDRPPQSNR